MIKSKINTYYKEIVMFPIKICNKCITCKTNIWQAGDINGFFEAFIPPDNKCPYCHNKLQDINISYDELKIIKSISCDISFIQSMLVLKEKDIIEYNLKMSQFRNQVEQQNSSKIPNDNTPKCPTCNSTDIKKITGTSKAVSVAMWGLLSRKVHKQWHCNNCGSEW